MLNRHLKGNKRLVNFVFGIEKLANIAAVKAAQKDNVRSRYILERMRKVCLELMKLKASRPDLYGRILAELHDIRQYNRIVELPLPGERPAREDDNEAWLNEVFKTVEEQRVYREGRNEGELVSLFVDLFKMVWRSALDAKNDEITRGAIYEIEYLLDDLAHQSDQGTAIETILQTLNSTTFELVVKKSSDPIDPSVYPAAVNWYSSIVLNGLQDVNRVKEYLGLFNKYFFASIKLLITNKANRVFKEMVSGLVDGTLGSFMDVGDVWGYKQVTIRFWGKIDKADDEKIDKLVIKLGSGGGAIDSVEELDVWLKDLSELNTLVISYVPADDLDLKKKAEKAYQESTRAILGRFKYHHLLRLMMATGAYCLFHKRYDLIDYLWSYKQPHDSDAVWGGTDLVPSTVDGLVRAYLDTGRRSEFDFWEDHHGSQQYINRYFIFSLAHILQNTNFTGGGQTRQATVDQSIKNLDVHELSGMTYTMQELKDSADRLQGDKETKEVLGTGHKALLEDTGKFLLELKEAAEKALEEKPIEAEVSLAKIAEFRSDVVSQFRKVALWRSVFEHFGIFVDKSSEVMADYPVERTGINIVEEKAVFLDDWYVHYGKWGEHYGESLARFEDNEVYGKIVATATKKTVKNIDKAIDTIAADMEKPFLVATRDALYGGSLGASANYISKWHQDKPDLPELIGLEGWIKSSRHKYIPVFDLARNMGQGEILVLDAERLGTFEQLSPLKQGESSDKREGNFYFNIQEFAKEADLVKKFLEQPPQWLAKEGDAEQQKKYLLQRVILHIFSRFVFSLSSDFRGYKIILSSEK